jgi:hypothetical protein
MRRALFATAAMNVLGAAAFVPAARSVRALAGFPADAPPLYLMTIAALVLVFGLGYLRAAVANRAERLFIGVAAAGKLSFFGLLVWFSAAGALPLRAVLTGAGDLVFGVMFLVWLFGRT